ncbi:MAG: alcohol dehydrogenase catalytic domain-containing protein, partial [Bdellovibrionales bacterium]
MKTEGFAASGAGAPLAPFTFERRRPGPHDVHIDILFCGVCHSDLHTARNEWKNTTYPCVPGHEIVGRVIATGAHVKKIKAGDLAGVGCMVDSCRTCPSCRQDQEQYCEGGATFTYNSSDRHMPGAMTYGGYATQIVVDEAFVLRVSEKLDLAAVAPLLCAG